MPAKSQAGTTRRALAASALVGALVVAGFQSAPFASAKDLDDYATWDDVVAAQGDIDRQNQLIDEIKVEISGLEKQVTAAEAEATEAGNRYGAAQEAAHEAAGQAYTLQTQADEAAERADAAEREAGAMGAAMSNRLGSDPTVELLTQPDEADDFLMGMSTLSKLGTYSSSVYESAVAERNNATQLTEQAEVALAERERLEAEAESAYQAAVDAQNRVQKARDTAVDRGAELEAMLIPLQEHREVVEADYREGERLREEERRRQEEERRRQEEERRRRAEEAAAAAAAAAAKREADAAAAAAAAPAPRPAPAPAPAPAPSRPGGGGGGAPTSGGVHGPMGSAWITSYYGYRLNPLYFYSEFHAGIDLVNGSTCGTPLYAISSGTVTFAGWIGGYGYTVDVVADNGSSKYRYAHIMPGGINVYPGQHVGSGHVVAYAGTTGMSTGCHLHLEIFEGGANVDPYGWLAARGIYY